MITTEQSVQNSAYGGLGSPVRSERATARKRSGAVPARTRGMRLGSSSLSSRRLAWLLPALAALALYLPTLAFGFVWDDLELIVGNSFLHAGSWDRLLASDYWASTGRVSGMWRPLVMASFRVDGVSSGFNPAHFHLVNALLHSVSTALVAGLALELGAGAMVAGAVALCFATAPAASESVAWISGRTDLLCGLFVLAAVLLERRARTRGVAWRGAALLATAGALLSKETALVLPIVLLLLPQKNQQVDGVSSDGC